MAPSWTQNAASCLGVLVANLKKRDCGRAKYSMHLLAKCERPPRLGKKDPMVFDLYKIAEGIAGGFIRASEVLQIIHGDPRLQPILGRLHASRGGHSIGGHILSDHGKNAEIGIRAAYRALFLFVFFQQ